MANPVGKKTESPYPVNHLEAKVRRGSVNTGMEAIRESELTTVATLQLLPDLPENVTPMHSKEVNPAIDSVFQQYSHSVRFKEDKSRGEIKPSFYDPVEGKSESTSDYPEKKKVLQHAKSTEHYQKSVAKNENLYDTPPLQRSETPTPKSPSRSRNRGVTQSKKEDVLSEPSKKLIPYSELITKLASFQKMSTALLSEEVIAEKELSFCLKHYANVEDILNIALKLQKELKELKDLKRYKKPRLWDVFVKMMLKPTFCEEEGDFLRSFFEKIDQGELGYRKHLWEVFLQMMLKPNFRPIEARFISSMLTTTDQVDKFADLAIKFLNKKRLHKDISIILKRFTQGELLAKNSVDNLFKPPSLSSSLYEKFGVYLSEKELKTLDKAFREKFKDFDKYDLSLSRNSVEAKLLDTEGFQKGDLRTRSLLIEQTVTQHSEKLVEFVCQLLEQVFLMGLSPELSELLLDRRQVIMEFLKTNANADEQTCVVTALKCISTTFFQGIINSHLLKFLGQSPKESVNTANSLIPLLTKMIEHLSNQELFDEQEPLHEQFNPVLGLYLKSRNTLLDIQTFRTLYRSKQPADIKLENK